MNKVCARLSKLVVPAILATCSQTVLAMPFQGSTSGSFTDETTATYLSFKGTDFGLGQTVNGEAALANLGQFTLLKLFPDNGAFHPTGNFNLTVTFTSPGGANPVNPIVAALSGTINKNMANGVAFDFGAGQSVDYSGADGSGSFFLTVLDVSFGDGRQPGYTQTLTGLISNAVFNPPTSPASTLGVPEPGTLALLGLGLAGLAATRRRKQ